MRLIRIGVGALLVGLVVAGPVLTVPTPAGAWAEGPCVDATGVTVVVDFHELGGGVSTRCAPGPVRDGFDALAKSGIAYRSATRSPGFVCRIDDKPASDPCVNPSPANAYWSYWVAPRGGQWCYSNLGAGSRTPPSGTVEGWSFAQDKAASAIPPPGISPPAAVPGVSPTPLRANDCDGSRTAAQPATPAPRSGGTPLATSSGVAPSPAVGPTPAGVPSHTVATASPSDTQAPGAATDAATAGGATTSDAPSAASPVGPAAAAAAASATPSSSTTSTDDADTILRATATRAGLSHTGSRSSGAPVGSIIALAAIVLVGGAAGIGARRRRSTRPSH